MQNANPQRINDEAQETIINQFLLSYYFERGFQNVQLNTNTELQHMGVDFTGDSQIAQDMQIDAKAQSSAQYINNPTPTFAFELSTFNRYGTDEFIGWFIHPDNITEYYTCVWIHSADVNKKGRIVNPDNIHLIEVMTIDKKKLRQYVEDTLKQYNLGNIDEVVYHMRADNIKRIDVCRGMHFHYSGQLIEKPINLVIRKYILKQFVIPGKFGHCFVTKDGVDYPKRRT